MKIVGITSEKLFRGEAEAIAILLESGVEVLHLRKPASLSNEVAQLLREIPQSLHKRIVIHNHHSLIQEFALKGIHLNAKHPTPPHGYRGETTRSCHSLEELQEWEGESYRFLSPIFDSISKQGYSAAFTHQELQEAKKRGIINQQVIALGGVTPYNIPQLKGYGFGGVALLGYLWQELEPKQLQERTKRLIEATQ